eukprot:gnl/TRDRNA2_/TRDRNA2_191049_c0_seq1.p1 gnl/TRDRNA2_/TRDRNA2_191049_c0~~gnl/TRDRNA2_/TRDRNA2_191049_c0_seq1.p1  ORF type:complete len:360 (-),score=38.37 gnl/TRDRNA2_/TRDRNA2_191049_c0_seq1:495-1574(-)
MPLYRSRTPLGQLRKQRMQSIIAVLVLAFVVANARPVLHVRSVPTAEVVQAVKTAPAWSPAGMATDVLTMFKRIVPSEVQQARDASLMQPMRRERRIAFPSPGSTPSESFSLVAFRSEMARALFQKVVSYFECPDGLGGWDRWSATWWRSQQAMETNSVANRNMLPVLAMKGPVPCAAAAYSDARTNDQNTFVLSMLIRNAREEDCIGSGAAIMCHLIRNSKNREGAFSPLKLTLAHYEHEPGLSDYVEAFGCTSTTGSVLGQHWHCTDPSPDKCEDFADEVTDADALYVPMKQQPFSGTKQSMSSFKPNFLAQTSRAFISVATSMVLIGFAAGGGIALFMRSQRHRHSTMGKENLLSA